MSAAESRVQPQKQLGVNMEKMLEILAPLVPEAETAVAEHVLLQFVATLHVQVPPFAGVHES